MGQAASCCEERDPAMLSDFPLSARRAYTGVPDDNVFAVHTRPKDDTSNAGERITHDGSAASKVDLSGTPGSELPGATDGSLGHAAGSAPEESEKAHFFLLNARKDMWRLSSGKDHVGVGAYFECVQGGAIRVRGLAKGGPAESSRMVKVGDELLYVDSRQVHGRPLSELGQFILGPPGTTVQLTLRSLSDKSRYDIFLTRSKASARPSAAYEKMTGEVDNTLRV